MNTYTKKAGRCLVKDGRDLVTIRGVGQYNPVEVDEFVDSVVISLNSHQAMKEALEGLLEHMWETEVNGIGIESPSDALEEAIKKAKKALTLANGGRVEDTTHLINQVRHLYD